MLRSAVAATAFLTRVPIGLAVRVEAADVTRGAWLFPVVGAAVGGLSGLVADVVAARLPLLAAGAIAVAATALLTGAIHLDALADAADALGGATREKALEIMRDHALGAYGVVALVLVVVLDAALFGSLAGNGDAFVAGLAAGAAGRSAMLVPAYALPYARSAAGLGRVVENLPGTVLAITFVLTVLLALPARGAGLAALGTATAVALVLTPFFRRRFGGATGDLLGATAKLAETAALALVVAVGI